MLNKRLLFFHNAGTQNGLYICIISKWKGENKVYYFIFGLVVGAVIASVVLVTWILRARSGEIQVYEYDGEIYPVLAVSSKKDFDKRYLLVKTVKYE